MDSEETKKKKIVIITVPHAACPLWPTEGHPCDYAAPNMARRLELEFELRDRLRTELFIATTPRVVSDMNRVESREMAFRRRLREYVRGNRESLCCLLDVHSYPAHDKSYGPFDLVLLPQGRSIGSYYYERIEEAVHNAGHRVGVFEGARNDIQAEMTTQFDLESVLLEFNEGLTAVQRSDIARFIAAAVAQ